MSCPGGAENAEGGMQSPRHNYFDADVELFQRRFNNGYNVYDDPLYVAWLRYEHPDSLPDPLHLVNPTAEEAQINNPVASDLMNTLAEVASGSNLDSSSGSESLSWSLSTTRNFISGFDTSKGKCNK